MKSLLPIVLLCCASLAFSQSPKKRYLRKDFHFSFGGGASFVHANVMQQNSKWNNLGGSFNIRMGYAPNTYWTIYLESKNSIVSNYTLENSMTAVRQSTFLYQVSGIGVTRFFKAKCPSGFINAGICISKRQDTETLSNYAEKGSGWGGSIGYGFQPINRLTIETNLIMGKVNGKPKYDSSWEVKFFTVQLSVNYILFTGYKARRTG